MKKLQVERMNNCYNCKHLNNSNSWYKQFKCNKDEEDLDCFNLKIISCNLFEEKKIDK